MLHRVIWVFTRKREAFHDVVADIDDPAVDQKENDDTSDPDWEKAMEKE